MKEVFNAIAIAQEEVIKNGLTENVVFCLENMISEVNIENFKELDSCIPITAGYFVGGKGRFDTPVGKQFDVVFELSDPRNYVKSESVLNFVSINSNIDTDVLIGGYSGVCLIDFPKGKPEMLSNLSEFMSTDKSKPFEMIYLTTKEVMDKILENL
jgi:hypothetical protein